MRGYLAMFRMKFIAGFQYRAAAWAGLATQFAWGFMLLMIYRAFYRSSGTAPDMTWSQLLSYVWLHQAFLAILMLWSTDGDLMSSITSGQVAYELCRPHTIYPFWYARITADRLASAVMRCLPILIVAFILPVEFRLPLPHSPLALLMFFLSLVQSLLLGSAVLMFIYVLTIVTLNPSGSRLLMVVLAEFLSGLVIPVPLMPLWLQRLLDFFPYRYVADLPLRLYSGSIAGGDAAFQLCIQAIWTVGLFMFGSWAMSRALRRAVIQGG